jgi:hypothetical protein
MAITIPNDRDSRFWIRAGEEGRRLDVKPHQLLDAWVDSISGWHEERRNRILEYLREYGISYENYGQSTQRPTDDNIKVGLVENAVDTAAIKVCKTKIIPFVITRGGTLTERENAKLANRFLAGCFEESDVFALDRKAVKDALIGDLGILKVCEREERVMVERGNPLNVWWDPEEALLTGKVSRFVEDHYVDKYQLVEMVKDWHARGKLEDCVDEEDLEKVIQDIVSAQYDARDSAYFQRTSGVTDVVMLREAWHLKSSSKAKDGRHLLTLKGKRTLVFEDFHEEELPHVFYTRKDPQYGLTSPGMVSAIFSLQREHSEVVDRIRDGHRSNGVNRIIIRTGSEILPLDDTPGAIYHTADPNGDVRDWPGIPVPPQTYEYEDRLVQRLQMTAGIPEMQMNGKLPEGITAAKSISMLTDIVTERLSPTITARESASQGLARRILSAVRRIAKRHRGKYVVRTDSESGKVLEDIDWREIELPVGSYRLAIFPTNFLSQTPAARYEYLSEMRGKGEISDAEFRSLSEIPDLENQSDLDTAPQDVVDKCIEGILSKGKVFVAESFDDHQLIVIRGKNAYNLARLQCPDLDEDPEGYRYHQKCLKRLANYINSAANWLKPPEQAPGAAAGGMPPPPDPMGGSMMPPGMPPPMDPMMGAAPFAPPMPGPPMGGPNPFGPGPEELMSNGPPPMG